MNPEELAEGTPMKNDEIYVAILLSKKDLSLIKSAIKLAIQELQRKSGEYPDVYRYDYCIRNNEHKIKRLKVLLTKFNNSRLPSAKKVIKNELEK